MEIDEYGNPASDIVLIQTVDEHDLALIENEIASIADNSDKDFRLIAVKVDDWNTDLSPWQTPAVFGKDAFGGGACDTLSAMLPLCEDKSKTYFIGGYSLAGLFALWAAYQTNVFKGVAAASPSVWFPDFENYVIQNRIKTESVYLSLGDKEEKTRNPVMAQVGNAIRSIHHHLSDSRINCTLEWNHGNHFKDADLRTAKAFAWLLNRMER
ncbi:MAG: esterase [Ruminococcus sp.]|nr:esterase [Ruminococcus sp.]